MAGIDTTSPHYKGKYASIYEVNVDFPNGGSAGDYVDIQGFAHYWNADRNNWCVNEERDEYWDALVQDAAQAVTRLKEKLNTGLEAQEVATKVLQESIIDLDTELKQADLATRKNKGYFVQLSELTENVPQAKNGDIAYIGNKYPYNIFRWKNGSWVDSGETGGEEVKSITNIGTINNPDDEDLVDNNGVLKLKDRDTSKGMGYVILRTDKTFAEQVTQPNTIYEIRYDFDLYCKDITIPEGCVLDFQGGNIFNGKVKGQFDIKGKPKSKELYVEGYNINDDKIYLSKIGLISNNPDYGNFNFAILKKILTKDCVLVVDDVFYITCADPIEIDFRLDIIGDGKIVLNTPSWLFTPKENASININGVSFERINGVLIKAVLIDYLINNVIIENALFVGFERIIEISSSDIIYSEKQFGLRRFIIDNCKFDNIKGTAIRLSNTVISEECRIDNNVINKFKIVFFEWGWNNDYVNTLENREYIADLLVRNNVVEGGITDYDYYNTFLLCEANKVYYTGNKISNVINIKNGGTAYDAYVSSKEYYCENNIFTNICCLPIDGDFVPWVNTPNEIFKSKQGIRLKIAKNNIWKIDFLTCKKLIEEYLNGQKYSEEQFNKMNFISIFRIVDNEQVIFDNNIIEILNGSLGLFYGGPSVDKLCITNNKFHFDDIKSLQDYSKLVGIDNIVTNLTIENNNFFVKSKKDFSLTSSLGVSNNTIQENCEIKIKNNTFNTGVYLFCKAPNIDISNNTTDYATAANLTISNPVIKNKIIEKVYYDSNKYLSLNNINNLELIWDCKLANNVSFPIYFRSTGYMEITVAGVKYLYYIKVDNIENSLYNAQKELIVYHAIGATAIWNKNLVKNQDINITASFTSDSIHISYNNLTEKDIKVSIRIWGENVDWCCFTSTPVSGAYSNKPTAFNGISIGYPYFCTDRQAVEGNTDGIMIYHKGNDVWVDALGRVVE